MPRRRGHHQHNAICASCGATYYKAPRKGYRQCWKCHEAKAPMSPDPNKRPPNWRITCPFCGTRKDEHSICCRACWRRLHELTIQRAKGLSAEWEVVKGCSPETGAPGVVRHIGGRGKEIFR